MARFCSLDFRNLNCVFEPLSVFFNLLDGSHLYRHSFFMNMISSGEEGTQVPGTEGVIAKKTDLPQALSQVRDLPVFKEASFLSLELEH